MRSPLISVLFYLAICGVASLAIAQEVAPAKARRQPGTVGEYKGRRIAQTMHYSGAEWLTRDNRE